MTELLTIRDLRIDFRVHGGLVRAVRGVSFSVPEGGSVALVGESGSGKTVVSQAIMGILPEIAEIQRRDPVRRSGEGRRGHRHRQAGARQPRHARHPRRPHLDHLPGADDVAVAAAHDRQPDRRGAAPAPRACRPRRRPALVEEMLRLVGFPDPARRCSTYPFELSGGLRQRAMIAMALVCHPALLIADEPTTALDVTIQAQILKLIKDLQQELGMAVLLITHDLGVVANMAEEVVVMYHGEVMESRARSRTSTGGPSIPI